MFFNDLDFEPNLLCDVACVGSVKGKGHVIESTPQIYYLLFPNLLQRFGPEIFTRFVRKETNTFCPSFSKGLIPKIFTSF